MSQEAYGSELASILWILWVFGSIYWLNQQSSLTQAEHGERRHGIRKRTNGEVVALPKAGAIPPGLEGLVSEVLRRSGKAVVEDFLGERLADYENVVAAFEAGNRKILHRLVAPEVYDVFSEAISEREARSEGAKTIIVRLEPPRILAGSIDGNCMEVSIRFVAESFKLVRNAAGYSPGNSPDKCRCVDIWTFAATSSPSRVKWQIVAT